MGLHIRLLNAPSLLLEAKCHSAGKTVKRETTWSSAQPGAELREADTASSMKRNVFVTIAQLAKPDSGLYRCTLGYSIKWIEIIVVYGEFLLRVMKGLFFFTQRFSQCFRHFVVFEKVVVSDSLTVEASGRV